MNFAGRSLSQPPSRHQHAFRTVPSFRSLCGGVDIFPKTGTMSAASLFGSLALVIDPSARTCARS
jgi:hypothetical protein